MGSDAIRELLLADGWEQVTGADLAEGDYVAWYAGGWLEGRVVPSLDSETPWWHERYGSIKVTDVLLRRPEQFAHFEARFDGAGEEHVNVHADPRQPVFVKKSLITSDLFVKEGAAYVSLRTKKVDADTLTKEKPA